MSPLCESYVPEDQLNAAERFYPLHAFVCDRCWLVQLLEYVKAADIYTEYAYFSSYSSAWLRHAEEYVQMINGRLGLRPEDPVVEVASNDGYLLQYFVQRGQRVLGIEPAANIARVAESKGVPSRVAFFGERLARDLVGEGWRPKLLLGNNVLAHVPNLNDFVRGLKVLLAEDGTITMEFPHLQRLIEGNQFDTIYHEHFSYFSLIAVERVFAGRGLKIFDVEELWTHGGSLRIYAMHAGDPGAVETDRLRLLRERELSLGYNRLEVYSTFRRRVEETKRRLLEFLIRVRREGKTVAGYGAPGKGNTLLNYCGIRTDFLDYVVDRNPYKQGKFLPGTHIPIFPPERLAETKPDYILILPWNLKDEIVRQLEYTRSWGARLFVPIPEPKVVG
jgi:2-polyprenyl-3-methyl-5-hydroxy-6-metoxy-1,4-benzoquinol methylase